jgi:inosine/xanthosine triphosphatase
MSKIIVASQNPVKINATRGAFAQVFPEKTWQVQGVRVASGVSDQPLSDAETFQGARNRATYARRDAPDAAYWVGLEGGLEDRDGVFHCFAWMVVQDAEREGLARTASFVLPSAVAALIRDGEELGRADDIVFGRINSKQDTGSVGLLTADRITRTTYYEHALVLALIPFARPDLSFTP